ncbi:hypothetical protein N7G274_008203 [Stereocaulon virgatum]|uniref:Mis6 domain-containing protein n=1 Tax=Stereocaulon virgatum TaxID=373712 RepID=A0ABR4A358_9LECA
MPTATVDQGLFPIRSQALGLTAKGPRLPQDLQKALDQIRIASETQAKKKHPVLKSSLEIITSHAESNGLSESALKVLIDVITLPNSFDQSSQNAIIKSLYPAGKVASYLIDTVIGSLGHGSRKSTVSTQQLLLQWINKVSAYLEEPSRLSSCYSVLFNLLDMMSLRTYLCQLLVTITRRKHVRPFRIVMLQELSRSVGQDAALIKLMRVFNKYSPGSFEIATIKKTSDYPHLDPEWASQLEKIQKGAVYLSVKANAQMASSRFLRQNTTTTFHTANSMQLSNGTDIIVDQLENIRISELTASDLEDPVMQRYRSLNPSRAGLDEVDHYLISVLGQQVGRTVHGQNPDQALSKLLEGIWLYTRHTKALPQSALEFFQRYLLEWNGQQNHKVVLNLLSYIPIQPFENLHQTIFAPLERAILSAPITKSNIPQTTLLTFYTTLLTSWTTHVLSTPSEPSPHQNNPLLSLLHHTSTLTLTLLTTSPTQHTLSQILTNLETQLPLLHAPLSLPIPPPSPKTIYLILFTSPSLSNPSRLSSILATYKSALEGNTAQQHRPPEHIPLLNAALMDTCNLLFRSRAFNSTDAHALGCLLSPPVIERLSSYTASLDPPQPLSGLFSLSSNPVLAALSIACFREMEDQAEEEKPGSVRVRHAGPVTQKSLSQLGREGGVNFDWKEYRVAVLKWLEAMGVKGVRELGGATMKGLLG